MAAAAQVAKPAGGIPLPKTVEEESPAEGALSEEKAQMEQEKLEQQRRKELEAKENEIRGLQHELDLERVEREKMHSQNELDKRVKQEEDRLKAEHDKLERDRLQLVQEKARQDNLAKAEEMKHQSVLDKATYKQEAEIAKMQAKATADLAKQQAQSLIATNDKARAASDKYYADANAKLSQGHPAISPALQNQLDGAVASLNRFRKVHGKQRAIPKPGTPPTFAKMAMVKWADENALGASTVSTGAQQSPGAGQTTDTSAGKLSYEDHVRQRREAYSEEKKNRAMYLDMAARGVYLGSGGYTAMRGAAYFKNQAALSKSKGDHAGAAYYSRMAAQAERTAGSNLDISKRKGNKTDQALYDSYVDPRFRINGWNTHKDFFTRESQYDRDSNMVTDAKAELDYALNGKSWYKGATDWLLDSVYGVPNSIVDAYANWQNANRFGANRFWNTTFDDESMRSAYNTTIQDMNYSDEATMGYLAPFYHMGMVGTDLAAIGAMPFTGGGSAALGAAKKALMQGGKEALKGTLNYGWKTGSKLGWPILNRALTDNTAPYQPGGEFAMYKYANSIPMPGSTPVMLKKEAAGTGSSLTAQAMNDAYDAYNLNNESYYSQRYSPLAKTLGGLISSVTGGLIQPYKAINKGDIYQKPKAPIRGEVIMNNALNSLASEGREGGSGFHRAVAQAAAEKHAPGLPINYNGTRARLQTVSGRTAANQLAEVLS